MHALEEERLAHLSKSKFTYKLQQASMGCSPIRAGLLEYEKDWMADYNKTKIVASKIDRLSKQTLSKAEVLQIAPG